MASPPTPDPAKLTTIGFISGALGACIAVTITNPMEVAKTRLQLDGELQSRPALKTLNPVAALTGGRPSPAVEGTGRVYNGAIDCMRKTWKYEGLRGIQRGLGAAYAYQIALNGSRLGFFEPFRTRLNRLAGIDEREIRVWSSVAAGASSGIVGAVLGNSLFLVKARMQAYSPYNPVGAQHAYTSVFAAWRSIVAAEGPKGLFRGMDAAILRTAMGSSVQLPAYGLAKSTLTGWGLPDGLGTFLLSSSFSGVCVLLAMQPADTALTRMYNQAPNSIGPDGKPRGLLYKNPIDCLYKTAKAEGVLGWYKGSFAHFLRIAPHTIVTLTANEMIGRYWLAFKNSKN